MSATHDHDNDAKHQATQHLQAHAHAIDALHHTLANLTSKDDPKSREHLTKAVEKYKKAHAAFADDVLFCMPTRT